MADALDDAALDLARGAERVDHPSDVVHGGDPVDPHLAGLDVDRHLGDLHAERQHLHARRVRARALRGRGSVSPRAAPVSSVERCVEAPVGRDDLPVAQIERCLVHGVALRGDLEDLPLRVGSGARTAGPIDGIVDEPAEIEANGPAGRVAERDRHVRRAGCRAPRPRSSPSRCATRCRCPASR